MSKRSQLSETLSRLLPGESYKRIREAILAAASYSGQRTDQLRKEIDQANRVKTGLLVSGTITILSTTSATLSGYIWAIDYSVKQPSTATTLTITAPHATVPREDYFIGTSTGTIIYRAGSIDTLGNSFPPSYNPLTEVVLQIVKRNSDGTNVTLVVSDTPSIIDFSDQYVIPYIASGKLKNTGIQVEIDSSLNLLSFFFPLPVRVPRQLINGKTFKDSYAKEEINGGLRVNELIYQEVTSSTISTSTTLSLNMGSGKNIRRYVLQANLTINFSADPASDIYSTFTFIFRQDGTGGKTVTWNTTGTAVLWQGGVAPLIPSGANEMTVITIIWTGQEYLGMKSCGFNV